MAKKVKIDDLADEIASIMKDFQNVTEENVDNALKKTAKDAVSRLKKANPPGSGEYGSWKEYNNSWKVMQTKTDKRYHRKATIHNERLYRLTHLLEKGHALVAGGRKVGQTRAFPHIQEVDAKAQEELMENIKKGI